MLMQLAISEKLQNPRVMPQHPWIWQTSYGMGPSRFSRRRVWPDWSVPWEVPDVEFEGSPDIQRIPFNSSPLHFRPFQAIFFGQKEIKRKGLQAFHFGGTPHPEMDLLLRNGLFPWHISTTVASWTKKIYHQTRLSADSFVRRIAPAGITPAPRKFGVLSNRNSSGLHGTVLEDRWSVVVSHFQKV